MSPGEWEALLAAGLDEAEPPEDGDEHLDPESSVLPPDEDLAAIEAETDLFATERLADQQYLAQEETAELAGRVAADQARKRGPRGPALPGSADRVPGVSDGPAGGFGAGSAWIPHPAQRPCTDSPKPPPTAADSVGRPRTRSSA
jgi:hypothetical protein